MNGEPEIPIGARVWFCESRVDACVDEWEIYAYDGEGMYALRPAGPDVDKRPLGTFWAQRSSFVPILPDLSDSEAVESWLSA